MTARIAIPSGRIAAFCKRWRVAELALFGSVVRDERRASVLPLGDTIKAADELSLVQRRNARIGETQRLSCLPNTIPDHRHAASAPSPRSSIAIDSDHTRCGTSACTIRCVPAPAPRSCILGGHEGDAARASSCRRGWSAWPVPYAAVQCRAGAERGKTRSRGDGRYRRTLAGSLAAVGWTAATGGTAVVSGIGGNATERCRRGISGPGHQSQNLYRGNSLWELRRLDASLDQAPFAVGEFELDQAREEP